MGVFSTDGYSFFSFSFFNRSVFAVEEIQFSLRVG